MTPAEVPDELVEKAFQSPSPGRYSAPTKSELRTALAAVLPSGCDPWAACPERGDQHWREYVKREKAQAQQDLITDLLAKDLADVEYIVSRYPIRAVPQAALLERRNRIARSTAKTEEPT